MRATVAFFPDPILTGLTYSAHRPSAFPGGAARYFVNASSYTGGWPKRVVGRGYPALKVVDRKDTYWFSSPAEIDLFCAVMGERLLPSGRNLAAKEGTSRLNSHWLSRVPKRSYKERRRLVDFIGKNDHGFRTLFMSEEAAPDVPVPFRAIGPGP